MKALGNEGEELNAKSLKEAFSSYLEKASLRLLSESKVLNVPWAGVEPARV